MSRPDSVTHEEALRPCERAHHGYVMRLLHDGVPLLLLVDLTQEGPDDPPGRPEDTTRCGLA